MQRVKFLPGASDATDYTTCSQRGEQINDGVSVVAHGCRIPAEGNTWEHRHDYRGVLTACPRHRLTSEVIPP